MINDLIIFLIMAFLIGMGPVGATDLNKAKEYFTKFLTLQPEGEQAAQVKGILEYLATLKK